jgi:hypothetical protein
LPLLTLVCEALLSALRAASAWSILAPRPWPALMPLKARHSQWLTRISKISSGFAQAF